MIITISRQFGSGGNRVGRLVAEQLGMPFYDKNIINHVADKLGFSPEYVKQVQEKPTGSSPPAFLYRKRSSSIFWRG